MGIHRKYRKPKILSHNEWAPSWLRILLLTLILLVVGWYGYQLGSAGIQGGLAVFKPSLQGRLAWLQEERETLLRKLTMAEQSAQMDQEAIRALKERVKKFQDERLQMEEELAFLRGIVSTGADKKALRIQKFKLSPGIQDDEFLYSFSVSQLINSGSVAKGRIYINLEGLQGEKVKKLGLEMLSEEKLKSLKMRFRYFQNVEGKLKIPSGFTPRRLIIEVRPESKKFEPVTETYDWTPVT